MPHGGAQPHHHRGTLPLYEGRLTIECDALWSFVGNKQQQRWLWLALDRDTREIVGVVLGKRDAATAQQLWESLSAVYRQGAVACTDFWDADAAVFPSKRQRAVGKERGQTSHIERMNNTLRQRLARLVRKTLSFSKNQAKQDGAIWSYIHHHNAMRAALRAPITTCT